MTISDLEVLAELSVLYPRYEDDLVNNHVDRPMNLFWARPPASRMA